MPRPRPVLSSDEAPRPGSESDAEDSHCEGDATITIRSGEAKQSTEGLYPREHRSHSHETSCKGSEHRNDSLRRWRLRRAVGSVRARPRPTRSSAFAHEGPSGCALASHANSRQRKLSDASVVDRSRFDLSDQFLADLKKDSRVILRAQAHVGGAQEALNAVTEIDERSEGRQPRN